MRARWDDGRIDAPVDALWELVYPSDDVRVDGVVVEPRPPEHYFVFHKPAGVLTARHDPYGRPSLEPWLDTFSSSVFPVGRLDKATTGLLLLTDDGDLAHMLLHPRFHAPKRYHATLASWHDASAVDVEQFELGLELQDGFARAEHASVVATHPNVVLRIDVTEGRNHMVRNMVRVAGYALDHLHRVGFGELTLGELGEGESRPLTADEVATVWEAVGGRDRVYRRRLEALRRSASTWREEGRPSDRLDAFLEREQR